MKRELAIPVVGNSDIRTRPTPRACRRKQTATASWWGGRRQGTWIFQGDRDAGPRGTTTGPIRPSRKRVLRRHWAAEAAYAGPAVAARTFRKHLLWYTKGLKGGAAFRQAAGRLTDETALLAELDRFFSTLAAGDGGAGN